ncbi:hypothetical protein ACFRJ8_14865 [Arthrobacter sp. NPDC056886]|uniref:hypothetical protein n=1 Tax=Arthrobacter sp. NPDC056886 TaxID=3345960 RepID=UPI0036706933
MQVQEVISMLRWINEGDPRVQFNDSAVEFWHYSLRTVDAAVAKQAVLEHVRQHEAIAVTPAAIAKRAGNIKSSRDAGQRAIEANPKQSRVHPMSWRSRNPEEWDRLVAIGAADRRRELGLPERGAA